MDNRVSALIPGQFPEHFRNEGSGLVSFTKLYFEFLECVKINYEPTLAVWNNFVVGDELYCEESKSTGTIRSQDSENNILFIDFKVDTLPRVGESIVDFDGVGHGIITNITLNPLAASKKSLSMYDIDNTVDDFIRMFKSELAHNMPDAAVVNKKHLYKHIKEYYQTRGSLNSYKFLFNILFDENVEIDYPADQILKPSDNTWVRPMVLRVNNPSATSFKGRGIVGEESGATVTVEYEVAHKIGAIFVKDLYLKRDSLVGTFVINEYVMTSDPDTVSRARVHGVLSDTTITNKGHEYSANDVVTITPDSTGGVGASIIVESINSGIIERINITTAGSGYALNEVLVFDNSATGLQGDNFVSAVAHITKIGVSGEIEQVTLSNNGRGYQKYPTITITTAGGSLGVLTPIGTNVGSIRALKIVENGLQYKNIPSLALTGIGDGTATVSATVASTYNSVPFYFKYNKSFASDSIYIIDSYYYQPYSYIIKVNVAIDKWRYIIKRLVHPAGMTFFNIFDVQTEIANSVEEIYTYLEENIEIIGQPGFELFFDNNDLNSQSDRVNFIDASGLNVVWISRLDLDTNPYAYIPSGQPGTDRVSIYTIDLKEDVTNNMTSSGNYFPAT